METGIPKFNILQRGKKKVWNYKKLFDSRSIKTELWFIHFSMAHFDTEKDKFCFSLTEKKMFTKSHAPKVEGYPQHHGLCFMKNSQQNKSGKNPGQCPVKRRNLEIDVQRKDNVRTHGEENHLQPSREASKETALLTPRFLYFQPPEL